MESMTLKQYARYRFIRLCEAYAVAKQHIDTPEGRAAFVALSVQIHMAKAHVPKYMWRLAR